MKNTNNNMPGGYGKKGSRLEHIDTVDSLFSKKPKNVPDVDEIDDKFYSVMKPYMMLVKLFGILNM